MQPTDITQITNAELFHEIELQAAGEAVNFDYAAEWLRRIGKGTVQVKQFDEAMARGASRRWPTLVERFNKGELFGCQWLDFTSMLMLAEDEVLADQHLWHQVAHAATAAGQANGEDYKGIALFAASRVSMPWKNRTAIVAPGTAGLYRRDLTKEILDKVDQARRRFDELPVKMGWWWVTGDKVEQARLKEAYAKRAVDGSAAL